MYPEIEKAGNLSNALNLEFAKINSTLKVALDDGLTYARVVRGNKFSTIYIALKEKLYLPDFWKDGVYLAHGKTDNLSDVAKAIDYWLNQDVTTKVFAEKFRFVQPDDEAEAFDENREVEYAWNRLLRDDSLGLIEFVKIASKDEILSKLFPFTSLYTLRFSRCTGFPYDTNNLPKVTPKPFERLVIPEYSIRENQENDSQTLKHLYVVTKNRNEYLGEGNAEEALEIVRANLPDNIKPAVKGTADG